MSCKIDEVSDLGTGNFTFISLLDFLKLCIEMKA